MIEIRFIASQIKESILINQILDVIEDCIFLGFMISRQESKTQESIQNQLQLIQNIRGFVNLQLCDSKHITNIYNNVLNENCNFKELCTQLEINIFENNGQPKQVVENPIQQQQIYGYPIHNDNQNFQSIIQNIYHPQNLYQPQKNNMNIQHQQQQRQNLFDFQQSIVNHSQNQRNFEKDFQIQDEYAVMQQQLENQMLIKRLQEEQESQQLAKTFQEEIDKKEAERLQKLIQAEEESIKIQCQICLDTIPLDEMATLSCTHIYHQKCLNQYCKVQINSRQFPIVCPSVDCKKDLKYGDLTDVLDDYSLQEFQQLSFKNYVEAHGDEYSWCPTPDCKYIFIAGGFNQLDCPVCKRSYCLNCKVDFHFGLTCQQYIEKIKQEKREKNEKVLDDQFLGFVRGAKFKQCPQCKFWVEKNQGCDHMTCRCKFQFCYVCGGVYQQCACVQQPIRRRLIIGRK